MQKQSRLSKFSCFEFSRLKGGGAIILRTYAGGGGSMKSVQVRTRGEGGPKLAILLRTYFMDAHLLQLLVNQVVTS